jgi:hypothetical protein
MHRYVAAIAIAAPTALLVILALSASGDSEPTGWTLVREPEGTTLYIGVAIVDCRPVGHVNVTETNESVTIHAYSGDGHKDCGDDWGADADFRTVS